MSDAKAKMAPCPYCGQMHGYKCPLVKAIEYFENGLTKRVEFYDAKRIGREESLFDAVFGRH